MFKKPVSEKLNNGQTLADRTKTGPSFQLDDKWLALSVQHLAT
jgi:hypothetical protein